MNLSEDDEARKKRLEEVLDRMKSELGEYAARFVIVAALDNDDTSGVLAIRGRGTAPALLGLVAWASHRLYEWEKKPR